MTEFNINRDITKAETLQSSFYKDAVVFEKIKEQIFEHTWMFAADTEVLNETESAYPFNLLPGFLNEPLLLTRNSNNELQCFSNVCTHRGNILVQHSGSCKKLQCSYHGRLFDLDGKFISMPEFKEAKDFPRPCDDLHKVNLHQWNQFAFVSIKPAFDFSLVTNRMDERIGFMPVNQFRFAQELSREYLVNANWALYCDNYLEGFHIPFVHPDLNKALDYSNYTTELFDYCNLQIGIADTATECFHLPANHIDYGKRIAAYYFWVFPNMMFNFYPWGLSMNIVKPLSVNQCKVSFLTYIYDETKIEKGAGALLDKVEREDELVVENVQRGIQSRFYSTGRFSPTKEKGVHHFHLLISEFMKES